MAEASSSAFMYGWIEVVSVQVHAAEQSTNLSVTHQRRRHDGGRKGIDSDSEGTQEIGHGAGNTENRGWITISVSPNIYA
jgi:hypothetical protein